MKLLKPLFLALSFCFVGNTSAQAILEKDAPGLFNQGVIHEFRIKVEGNPESILKLGKESKDSGKGTVMTKATVTVDGVLYPTAGVRYKGQSSYDFTKGKKKSLKVAFDKFGDGKKHKGYKVVNLLNNFKDPTMLREILYLDMCREFGVPAPRAAFARVYLNNEYLGLYTLTEQIDDVFCERTFGNAKGNLYKGQPRPELIWPGETPRDFKSAYLLKEKGDREAWSDLAALIGTIDGPRGITVSDADFVQRLDQFIDTKDMLRLWAINSFFMNIDAYNMMYQHNFYLYNNPYSGKFEWINYDGNYTFASWNPLFNLVECANLDIFYMNTERYPVSLQTKMFAIPYYRKLYTDQYYHVVQWYNYKSKFEKKVKAYYALIKEDALKDKNKETSNADFELCVEKHKGDILDPGAFSPGILPFMAERYVSVKAQLEALGYKF